jgi:hypothetical protein
VERAHDDHARQLIAQHLADREARYRQAPFPLYGLTTGFESARMLGQSVVVEEDGVERVEYLGLAYGYDKHDDAEPHVDVITAIPGGAPDPIELLVGHTGAVLPPGWRADDAMQALVAAHGPVQPITRRILIAGRPVDANGFETGQSWVLQATVDEHVVTVAATDYPNDSIALTPVTNLDDYIAGTQALLRT